MMSAAQCRMKAQDALSDADAMADGPGKSGWGQTAKEWINLAVMAEAQDHLLRTGGRPH